MLLLMSSGTLLQTRQHGNETTSTPEISMGSIESDDRAVGQWRDDLLLIAPILICVALMVFGAISDQTYPERSIHSQDLHCRSVTNQPQC